MMRVRPVVKKDLNALLSLAKLGEIGLTSLPPDPDYLKKLIHHSVQSFDKAVDAPQDECYLFVLEDCKKEKVVGCAGIIAAVGAELPFYNYKVSTVTHISHELGIRKDIKMLNFVSDYTGKTELCALIVAPAYRSGGNGALISRSRFLFMANHKARFANIVFAELRGVSDKKGISPFWQNVGQHFFEMSFAKADYLSVVTNKQFISDLMPRRGIYVDLLSKGAQKVLGKPHASTKGAMKILKKENFHYHDYIDIFDAGPIIEAKSADIQTIKKSRLLPISIIASALAGSPHLIATTGITFMATFQKIDFTEEGLIINQETAEGLKIKVGDLVRVVL